MSPSTLHNRLEAATAAIGDLLHIRAVHACRLARDHQRLLVGGDHPPALRRSQRIRDLRLDIQILADRTIDLRAALLRDQDRAAAEVPA